MGRNFKLLRCTSRVEVGLLISSLITVPLCSIKRRHSGTASYTAVHCWSHRLIASRYRFCGIIIECAGKCNAKIPTAQSYSLGKYDWYLPAAKLGRSALGRRSVANRHRPLAGAYVIPARWFYAENFRAAFTNFTLAFLLFFLRAYIAEYNDL